MISNDLTNHPKAIQCTHENEAGKTGDADVGLLGFHPAVLRPGVASRRVLIGDEEGIHNVG
jgi:hypothetical protein